MANKKLIKQLRNVAFIEQRQNKYKSKLNKQMKDGIDCKDYEPLFDWEKESKIAKTKLVLLGEDVNGT